MEFDEVKGFFYVAHCGSFTGAAEKLGLTQPAISLQVKRLERQLGERLFDRQGRGIRLTPAGEALFSQAEEVVRKFEELERVSVEIKDLDRGRLSIGASDTTSMFVLPELLRNFVEAFPKVELAISSSFSAGVLAAVRSGDVELGVVTLPVSDRDTEHLEIIPLASGDLVCIAPADHALAGNETIAVGSLAGERLISLERRSATQSRIDELLESAGLDRLPSIEFSSFEIVKRYVEAGIGVALVPRSAVSSGREALAVIELDQRVELVSALVLRVDRRLSHAARRFLAMAGEHFGVADLPAR